MTPNQVVPSISVSIDATTSQALSSIDPGLGLFLGGSFVFFFLFMIVVGVLMFILWIWSIIDIAKNNNFSTENTKILWLILVVLLGPIVSIAYYFARPKKVK